MYETAYVEKVKLALRIKHNKLDSEITDLIEAALADLGLAGVAVGNNDDALLLEAVKMYCRAKMTTDTALSELYEERYDKQKSLFMVSGKYGTYTQAVRQDE